jgi:acetylornithine deacetylase
VEAVDNSTDSIIEFTRELLRIPTQNIPPTGDEALGQEYVLNEFRNLELNVDVFQPDEIEGLYEHEAYHPTGSSSIAHEYSGRPNVVARWAGTGLGNGRSLIMAAHMDVVPPGDPQAWSHNPWGAELDDEGRIFARGAVDNKGPMSAMIMATRILKNLGVVLDGDLTLQSVVDEEFGGGNGTLATILRGYSADGVISVEPSDMAVCPSTFGCVSISFTMEGIPAHGTEQWKSINPIDGAALLHQALSDWRAERNQRVRSHPLLAKKRIPLPLLTRAIMAGADLGGASIPRLCEVIAWLAVAPGEVWSELENETLQFAAEITKRAEWPLPAEPKVQRLGRFLEGTEIPGDHPLCKTVERNISMITGERAQLECGTSGDLYLYTNHGGIPGIILGPGKLSLAHGIDEYISVADLLFAVKVYALTIYDWCGGSFGD